MARTDLSSVSLEHLLHVFQQGPGRVTFSIAGLADDELLATPRGEKSWSIQQILLHLCDVDLQNAFRVRRVWSEPGSDLPAHAQDVWSARADYQGQGARMRENALMLIPLLREHMFESFRKASAAEWALTGNHPNYGRVTLRDLLEICADHSERHLSQILHIRSLLGRPLEMPLLLEGVGAAAGARE